MYIPMIWEFIQLSIAYILLVIGWGAFIFQSLKRSNDKGYNFFMYLIGGNAVLIHVGYILSFIGWFNRASLLIGLLLSGFGIRWLLDREGLHTQMVHWMESIHHLFEGRYGVRLFIHRTIEWMGQNVKRCIRWTFWQRPGDKIMFLGIIAYNIYFFGYNRLKFVSYGAPDEEIHLYWVQSLLEGNIFPSGLYPHGFHQIIGALGVFTGLDAVQIIGSFGVFTRVVVLAVLYFGLRKIFSSTIAIATGLTIYSVINIFDVEAIYRFQFAIPQEYGMLTFVPMLFFLLHYIKEKRKTSLYFWGISFGLTLSFHFYLTIIAAFLCLGVGLIYLITIFKKRLVLPLMGVGLMMSILALSPLIAGGAMGYPMEQSMEWAVRIIRGDEYANETEDEGLSDETEQEENAEDENAEEALSWQFFLRQARRDWQKHVVQQLWFGRVIALLVILGIVIYGGLYLQSKKERYRMLVAILAGYGLLMFLTILRALQLPTLMEIKRVSIFIAYFSPMVFACPIELFYQWTKRWNQKLLFYVAVLACIPVVVVLGMDYEVVQPKLPFYYFQPKGAMEVNRQLIQEASPRTWTIIAPVNNISVVMNDGYHYELAKFILEQEQWTPNKQLEIPGERVYLYIEKKPLVDYGFRFLESQEGITRRKPVSHQGALEELEQGLEYNDYYQSYRYVLNSKAYFWAQQFRTYFPEDVRIYYEDDEFIVYEIKQDEYARYNFAIDYGYNSREREE